MRKERSGCAGCVKYLLFIVIAVFLCAGIAHMLPSDGGITVSDATLSAIAADGYYYRQLSDTEQTVYKGLLSALQKGALSCSFENVDYDTVSKMVPRAIYALVYDHPEYYWLNGGSLTYANYGYGSGHDTLSIDLYCYAYWTYTTRQDAYQETLRQKVREIASKAASYGTAFEQIRYVHDYLVLNTVYDHDALEQAKKTQHNASCEYIYSAYGCLINGRAVCAGYAKAFQLIMNELGYECVYISGDAGGPHAWNMLTVDGNDYLVDVTWDDKDHRDKNGKLKYPHDAEYNYFCVTTQQISRNHTADTTLFSFPLCIATDYNYYKHSGLLLDNYNRKDFAAAIDTQQEQQILSVQFTSQAAYKKAVADVIDDHYWASLSPFAGYKSVRYSASDELWILTLYK